VIVYHLVGHGAVCVQMPHAFTSCDTASHSINLLEGLSIPGVYLANIVVVDLV